MAGDVTPCPEALHTRELLPRELWPNLVTALTGAWGPEDAASAKVLVCSGCEQWLVFRHHQLGCILMGEDRPCEYLKALDGLKNCPLGKWPKEK